MITTVIFDLSEVYLHGFLGIDKILNKHYKLKITKEDLSIPELKMLFRGELSEEKYWRALITKFNLIISPDGLKQVVRNNFTEIEGVRQIIEDLKRNNYKLGLLSIHAKEWVIYCEKQFNYHKLFDCIVYSFETGICKPDRRSYGSIIAKLGAKPNECLFIDDSEMNLIAAKKVGITTIKFETAQKLRRALKSLRIKIG